MPPDSTLTDIMYKPRRKSQVRWIWELRAKHDGETCFLLGNGWSITYYDPHRIKEETQATLIGCNRAFQKWPLDYVIWQDSAVSDLCVKATCTKIMPYRKMSRFSEGEVDYSSTYFFGFGEYGQRFNKSSLELSNSGSLALQLAHYLGFGTIILLGCDCEFIMEKNHTLRSNIFKDKQAQRTNKAAKLPRGAKLEEVQRDGCVKYTNKNMLRFAKKFEELYGRFKNDTTIYRMGRHGILRIPALEDYEPFWTDKHPGRSNEGHDSRTEERVEC